MCLTPLSIDAELERIGSRYHAAYYRSKVTILKYRTARVNAPKKLKLFRKKDKKKSIHVGIYRLPSKGGGGGESLCHLLPSFLRVIIYIHRQHLFYNFFRYWVENTFSPSKLKRRQEYMAAFSRQYDVNWIVITIE